MLEKYMVLLEKNNFCFFVTAARYQKKLSAEKAVKRRFKPKLVGDTASCEK